MPDSSRHIARVILQDSITSTDPLTWYVCSLLIESTNIIMKYKQWDIVWCVLFLKHMDWLSRVFHMKLLLCVHGVVVDGVQYAYIFDSNADD